MLESIIYARDHFLQRSSEHDDLTPDQNESISLFPSHAYLVCSMISSSLLTLPLIDSVLCSIC